MLAAFMKANADQIASIQIVLLIINIIVHIIFAGAVAKDGGQLSKNQQKTILVSTLVWSFTTLLGGIWVATIYWVLHHSKLTRG